METCEDSLRREGSHRPPRVGSDSAHREGGWPRSEPRGVEPHGVEP